jgi:hypothetical protein
VPGVDHAVELQDLHLEHPQLGAERGETRACHRGHSFVTWINADPEQFLDPIAPDRRDSATTGHVAAAPPSSVMNSRRFSRKSIVSQPRSRVL